MSGILIDLHYQPDAAATAENPFALRARAESEAPVLGLVGRSGSGKTTLLHLIAGLKRGRGRIIVGERTLLDSDERINLPPERRRLGVVFQEGRLFPHLNVQRNLRYGQRRTSERGGLSFDEVVDLLELRALLNRMPNHLSGGEQRRVALGRAVLSQPDLLLLDEPLTGLDPRMKRQIMPLFQRLRDALRVPIIYITHDLAELLALTEHALLLRAGESLGCGRVHDLVQQEESFDAVHELGLVNVLPIEVISPSEAGVTLARLVGAGSDEREERPALRIPQDAAAGTRFSIAIRPEDIALSRGRIDGLSIQNQLPGRVARVSEHHGRVVAEIDIGALVLVELSARARQELQIEPGAGVHCLIKTSAIQRA